MPLTEIAIEKSSKTLRSKLLCHCPAVEGHIRIESLLELFGLLRYSKERKERFSGSFFLVRVQCGDEEKVEGKLDLFSLFLFSYLFWSFVGGLSMGD